MSKNRYLYAIITFIGFLCGTFVFQVQAEPQSGATADFAAALENIQKSGVFSFLSDVIQTERPGPRLENIGRQDETTRIQIEGQVNRPEQTSHLTFTTNWGGADIRSALKVVDGVLYEQLDDGSWEETKEGLDMLAPNGNPLEFLNYATDIEYAGAESLYPAELLPPDFESITRISFNIDPQAFGDALHEQTIEQLKARNLWRPSLQLSVDKLYDDLTGEGELWITTEGLPLRQILHLETPSETGDRISARSTTDFSEFAPLPASSVGLLPSIMTAKEQTQLWTNIMLLGIGLVLATIFVRFYESRRFHISFVSVMIVSLVFTPLLQSVQAAETQEIIRQINTEASEKQVTESESKAPTASLLPESKHNPLNNPMLQSQDVHSVAASPVAAGHQAAGSMAAIPMASTPLTSGTDTDGDGLNDEIELRNLGTNPYQIDTDGDTISDLAEVSGFDVNGVTWYLDPLSIDSNGDSVPDNMECVERVNVDRDGNLVNAVATPCGDLDGDGIPDVFDYDNDGDQVPDKLDVSPAYTGDATRVAQDRFKYTLTGYNINQPLKATIEIQPQDLSHLYLSGNVYDWPTNDTEGQISRVFNDTLANHGVNTDAAKNGDIMVNPELEIKIPWDPANPTRSLPISATVPITSGTPLNKFVDQGYLNEYRVGVRQEADGTVYLSALLQSVEDIGDRIVAWHSEIPYFAKSAAWGADHEARLVWTVSGLVDRCDSTQAPSGTPVATYCDSAVNPQNWSTTFEVIHRYYADFYVTGFSMEEDFGLNVALIAEDDSLSTPYEDGIWHLTEGLQSAYLDPQTLADGSRFGINAVVSRFQDGSSASATERWGLPADIFTIGQYTYNDSVRGLNEVVETQTGNFLRTTYPAPAANDHTNLLFLQEKTDRKVALADGSTASSYTASTKQLTATFTSVQTQTVASYSWRPFEYTSGNWQAYQVIDPYVTSLITDVTPLLTNANLDQAIGAGISDYDLAQQAALAMIKMHYMVNYAGRNVLVDLAGTPVRDTVLDDAQYQLNGNDPLLELVSAMIHDFYLLAQTETIFNLDGEIVSLTGYAPITDQVQFAHELGQLAEKVFQDPNQISWSTKNGMANGAAASLTYLLTRKHGYNYTQSATGFKLQRRQFYVMLAAALPLLIGTLIGSGPGGPTEGSRALMATAMAIMIVGQGFDVAKSASQVKHFYAAKRALALAQVLDDTAMATQVITRAHKIVTSINHAAKMMALYGFIFDLLIEAVVFVFTIVHYKLKTGTVAYNLAVARLIAGVIVSTITLVITLVLIAAVGGPIAALVFLPLAIFDAIFALACYVDNRSPDDFFCKGITGTAVQALADELNKYHVPLNFSRSDRLGLSVQSAALISPTLGYVPGNTLTVTLGVKNRQYPSAPPWRYDIKNEIGGPYHHTVPSSVLSRAAYEYFVDDRGRFHSNNLTLGSQAWTYRPDGSAYYLERAFTPSNVVNLPATAGINKALSPLYLWENGNIPVLTCWTKLAFYECDSSENKFYNRHELNNMLKFDMLPATFGEFIALTDVPGGGVRMNWDSSFPNLLDGDGDNLLFGADPYDGNVDTDGDGLLDRWELSEGFDPFLADSDNDQLSDYWEVFYSTNPFAPDTDADGLLDGQEVFHPPSYAGSAANNVAADWSGGWQVVYDYDGTTPKRSAVVSNPKTPDSDGDLNSDHYEFIYKFNPRAAYSIDPLKVESADIAASTEHDYIVPAGATFNYSVTVQSNLDTSLRSFGLLEAELPEDTIQQTQAFSMTGQQTLYMGGSLTADRNVFTKTQSTNMTIRAGAYTQDVGYSPPSSGLLQMLPLDGVDALGYVQNRSGNGNNGDCEFAGSFYCPDFSQGYADFTTSGTVWANLSPALSANSLSLSFWIFPTQAFASDRQLLDMIPTAGGNVIHTRIQADGKTIFTDFYPDCSTPVRLNASQQLVWGQWNHVVITHDGSNGSLYVNGVGSTTSTGNLCSDILAWDTGGHQIPLASNARFSGGMRNLAVYQRVLSDLEIQYEATVGQLPLFEFGFDEPPASSTYYEQLNPATRYATCDDNAFPPVKPCPFGGLPGLSNQAVLFRDNGPTTANDTLELNGIANHYGFGDINANKDTSFTLMTWVKGLNWSGSRDVLIADEIHGSNCDFECASFGVQDGHPYLSFEITKGNVQAYTAASTTLATDRWYHLAWQRDLNNNKVRIFVDGVMVMEETAAQFIVPYNSKLVFGGNYSAGGWYQNYHGWLDNFMVFSGALSTTEIQNAIRQTPLLNLHLDEDVSAGTFVNSGAVENINATCTNCPTPGARGQMREAPVFERGDTLTLSGDGLSALNTSEYAITMWVMPDFQLADRQLLLAQDSYELALTSDMKLSFCDGSDLTYTSASPLGLNRWNHLVVSNAGGNPVIFINGIENATTTSNISGNCAGTAHQVGGTFVGRLDEVAIYGQPLLELQVQQQYDYQARWFDSRIRPTILVDNDPPIMNIVTPGNWLSDSNGQQIMFTAVDAGVGLDYQLGHYIQDPTGATFNMEPSTTYTSSQTYIATIPNGVLWRGGTYIVGFHAKDLFGFGFGEYYTTTFKVDNNAPDASLDNYPSVLSATDQVTLTGTITDSVSFYGSSGVAPSSLQVRLLENSVPATSYYPATLSGEQWQAVIAFDGLPYGEYQVELLAKDKVGNSTLAQLNKTFSISGYTPKINLLRASTVITTSTSTLYGVAQTLPYPGNQSVYLPFETVAPLVDGSGNQYAVTCTSCPTTNVAGRLGRAASFTPTNSLLVSGTITSTTGTFMLWLKPDWSAGSKGHNPVLATSGQMSLMVDDNLQTLIVDNGSTQKTVSVSLNSDTWHHLALVTDGTVWTAYLDGQATGTITQTLDMDLPWQLGASSNGFSGQLDEVVLYQEPVLPYLIYDLAHPLNHGVTQARISPRSLETGLDDWRPVVLGQSNANFTTWTYDFADTLEGPYQLDLSVTDQNGLSSIAGSVWNGIIDTQPPVVTLSANFNQNQVEVTCGATDQYLSEANWDCPLGTVPTQSYETASWFVDTFNTTTHLVGLNAGPGTIPIQAVSMTACDMFGQCSTDSVAVPGNGGIDTIFEIGDYALVYQLDLPANATYNGAQPAYSIDRSAQVSNFDRVAYYLELENGSEREWVYVSMDTFNNAPTQIGVPIAQIFEQDVANLIVMSNVPGVSIGGPFASGNIEFWHHCYDPAANSGLGGSSVLYDFDDTPTAAANCYGSMQIHRDGNTLFAWNAWDDANADDIGIGNNPGANPDWTSMANSGNWTTRRLYVLARPVAAAVPDLYTVTPGVPLTVPAPGVLSNDENVISATLVTPPAHGTLQFQSDGSFIYEMTESVASDSFIYRVTDGYFLQKEATVTINRHGGSCFVETNGDAITDGVSTDASALRNAVQSASVGDTIKVSGSCAGVAGNQLLAVDKELTLAGGYQPLDWLAPAQPTVYPATLDAQAGGITLVISDTGNLTASGLILTNGKEPPAFTFWEGAGIRNSGHLTLSNSIVKNNNHSGGGYAIFNAASSGWMEFVNTSVLSNTGGGIINQNQIRIVDSLIAGNDQQAIQNESSSSGPESMTISGSVLRDNVGNSPLYIYSGHVTILDSAIVNNEMSSLGYAAILNQGTLTMTNSTVSGNRSVGTDTFGNGGATGLLNKGVATLLYSTIVNNTATNTNNAFGVRNEYSPSDPQGLTINGTVIADNSHLDGIANCGARNLISWPTYDYTFTATGSHNLTNDSTCGANFTNANPLLAPLANPTSQNAAELFHDLGAGSPLLDAISVGTIDCGNAVNQDQRGLIRPINGSCDIGAVEYSSDSTAPTISITQYLTETTGSLPMFIGLATDHSGIASFVLHIVPNSGTAISRTLTLVNDQWSYTIDQPFGRYNFYLEAKDIYNNIALSGPHPFAYANLAPITVNDTFTMTSDAVTLIASPGVLANDSDPYGDSLTAALLTQPSNGNIHFNIDGTFVYTPTQGIRGPDGLTAMQGIYGTDSFTYQASDGLGLTATATISITREAPILNLSIATDGTGTGSITLDPPGGSYVYGTSVTVTPSANTGSTFSGWSGACTGTGNCVITMDANKSVTATFTQIPLNIELATFDATQTNEQIVIRWQTISELDNLGFNLYRSTEFSGTEGELIQLNSALIPSQAPGSGQGSMYEWFDTDVQAGTTYYYWLKDVDVNGERGLHGPVSATMGVPTAIGVQQLTQQSYNWLFGLLMLILLGLMMLGRIGWELRTRALSNPRGD